MKIRSSLIGEAGLNGLQLLMLSIAVLAVALIVYGRGINARGMQNPQTAQGGTSDPPIRNFLRINENFCTGGQPKVEHFEAIKAMGVKAVINLRQPSEHRADEERELVEKLGMKYINIPVVFANPLEEQATEFLRVTDDPANRPAFIHCTAAIRVGAFWMIRRVLRDGWTIERAEEEARQVGLRESPHLVLFATNYIEKHRKGAGDKR